MPKALGINIKEKKYSTSQNKKLMKVLFYYRKHIHLGKNVILGLRNLTVIAFFNHGTSNSKGVAILFRSGLQSIKIRT